MNTGKKTTTGKKEKKLKLKKENIKDMDVKSKGKDIRGGVGCYHSIPLTQGNAPS